MRGREQQIREKQEREKAEEQLRHVEEKLLSLLTQQQKKIKEDYERRCAKEREEYRNFLLKQVQDAEEARVRILSLLKA